MAFEAHQGAADSHLIDSLSFKLRPGAQYIQDRANSSFYASGGNSYSAAGVRMIKFQITSSNGWMDPQTAQIRYVLKNTATTAAELLTPLVKHGAAPFSRCRIQVGGALIEDISDIARLYSMFSQFQSSERRLNDEVAGLPAELAGAGATTTVCFTPLSGLFQSDKYLPLKLCQGVTVELEINSDAASWLDWDPAVAAGAGTNALKSQQWEISDARLMVDIVTVDPELANQYTAHIVSGRNLPINLSGYISIKQASGPGQASGTINVTRALSRLKTLFISAMSGADTDNKEINTFRVAGPNATVGVSVGAKRIPESDISSSAEAWYRLRMALGTHASAAHSTGISRTEWESTKFVIGLDTEKSLQASSTGLNTKSGDLLTVKYANWAVAPESLYVVMCHEMLLSLSDRGVEVYD